MSYSTCCVCVSVHLALIQQLLDYFCCSLCLYCASSFAFSDDTNTGSNRILFVSQKSCCFLHFHLPNDTSRVTFDSRTFCQTDGFSAPSSSYVLQISSNGGLAVIFVPCQSFNMSVSGVFLTDDQGEDLSPKQA